MQRWVRFASMLSAPQCESLVQRAMAEELVPDGLRIESLADAEATEGWCLATKGYVPHGVVPHERQQWLPRGCTPVRPTLH
jgi:hypothetical protein